MNTVRIIVLGWLVIVTGLVSSCRRPPMGDSEANRTAEAQKFVTTMDLRAIVDSLAEEKAAIVSGLDKNAFRAFILREMRWSSLEDSMASALAKNFTTPEIRALADFQNSPVGKSLLGKYSSYQADIGPAIQAEIQRALAAEAFSRTSLRWGKPQQELTIGPVEESQAAEYAFRNEGRQTVRLLSISTSCGCTTAKLEKTVYQPGESGVIRVIFAKGNLTGVRNEAVRVTTDEPNHPVVALLLKATISESLKITPPILVWEPGEKTETKTVTLEIPAGAAMDIVGVESVPGSFSVKTVLDKGSQIYLAHLTPRASAQPMAGKFIVLAAVGGGKVLRIPVYLRILSSNAPAGDAAGLHWDDALWIDVRPAAEFRKSHIPGALPLTEEAWDGQFESVLARWTPGKPIVVFGLLPGQAAQVIRRLKAYGLKNLYIIASQG